MKFFRYLIYFNQFELLNQNNEKSEEPTEILLLVKNMPLVLFCYTFFL